MALTWAEQGTLRTSRALAINGNGGLTPAIVPGLLPLPARKAGLFLSLEKSYFLRAICRRISPHFHGTYRLDVAWLGINGGLPVSEPMGEERICCPRCAANMRLVMPLTPVGGRHVGEILECTKCKYTDVTQNGRPQIRWPSVG